MAELRLHGVEKVYPGGVAAVCGIDLAVADGEMTVLVGPSGCGKSTLLRMVAGLETVTRGRIEIGGRPVDHLEPAARDIAMVFQNYALYPHMSVFDNMAYGLRNRRMPRPEIDRRVRATAAMLGLEDLLDRRPRQLSGGQRQRVAMGRAIVREPEAFLFDEPLSNLDAKLRVQMRLEIRRLQRRVRTTGLYVTHDQVEAMTLADRLVVMNAGRAEQVGAPLDVYERPATAFVAAFIGSPAMNFLPGRLADGGRAVALDAGPRLTLPPGHVAGADGSSVTVGIRPEHLTVAGTGVNETAGKAQMRIDLVEALGADTLLHGPVGSGDAIVVLRAPGGRRWQVGEQLPLSFPPGRLHLFDPESGRRIETAVETAVRAASAI